ERQERLRHPERVPRPRDRTDPAAPARGPLVRLGDAGNPWGLRIDPVLRDQARVLGDIANEDDIARIEVDEDPAGRGDELLDEGSQMLAVRENRVDLPAFGELVPIAARDVEILLDERFAVDLEASIDENREAPLRRPGQVRAVRHRMEELRGGGRAQDETGRECGRVAFDDAEPEPRIAPVLDIVAAGHDVPGPGGEDEGEA